MYNLGQNNLLRIAFILSLITIGYNLLEGLFSLASHSLPLTRETRHLKKPEKERKLFLGTAENKELQCIVR
jgi:hypothetical protein